MKSNIFAQVLAEPGYGKDVRQMCKQPLATPDPLATPEPIHRVRETSSDSFTESGANTRKCFVRDYKTQ